MIDITNVKLKYDLIRKEILGRKNPEWGTPVCFIHSYRVYCAAATTRTPVVIITIVPTIQPSRLYVFMRFAW